MTVAKMLGKATHWRRCSCCNPESWQHKHRRQQRAKEKQQTRQLIKEHAPDRILGANR